MMKTSTLISCLATALIIGCTSVSHEEPSGRRHEEPSGRHLTEAQAIAYAKPWLPQPAGESYRVRFRDGVWEVWTDRDGSNFRSWTFVKIRDSDGKVLGLEGRM
jgi:hypothetical protein